jgi:predicted nucleic acid-binding protein
VTLIDTSAWIHSLRRDGDREVRDQVRALLAAGTAAWCPIIRAELWNGARAGHEEAVLRDMERDLVELPLTPKVWDTAYELARTARGQGLTVPTTDIVVQACANHHGAGLLHADEHLRRLTELALQRE